jgi:hypothetical protein
MVREQDAVNKGIRLVDGPAPASFARRLAEEQATTRMWMSIAEAAGDRAIVAEKRAHAAERRAMRAERALAASRQPIWHDLALIVGGLLLVGVVCWVSGVRLAG